MGSPVKRYTDTYCCRSLLNFYEEQLTGEWRSPETAKGCPPGTAEDELSAPPEITAVSKRGKTKPGFKQQDMSKEALTPPPSEVTRTSEEFSDKGGEECGEDLWELEYGEEQNEEAEPEEVEEEEEEEQVFYESKDFVSRPYLSEGCTVPEDILQFDYSYGYDCQRLFNLCVVDGHVLIFASGNLIHFLDVSTGKKWYRRCFSGCGIGHITNNPKEPHIAVGEKGDNPLVIIYEWPSFEIVTILKGGTKKQFTFLNYSPDGELLCSQGGYPDYMLTIWNWRKHKIMLRSKAYGQTVFNSRFSLFVPGHLTSSGIGHIKFWKINRTFTGLKLLGELGRFGKSEICNIVGFLALPDEKVVSGCEWGNILVWDAGLIRVEVFRRGKNYCHEAPITQFIYNNGELTTVAMDGTVKVWYYETIELADPPEEDRFIEVEPIFEYEVGDYYHKAKLLVIVEAEPDDPDNHLWYGQDANGGIWKLDLSIAIHSKPPALVFQCHAGAVVAIQCSPFSPHLASLGEDGKLFIYDYKQRTMILKKEFLAGGSSLLWLPLAVEDSGCVLIGGFTDGVIRVVCVSLTEYSRTIPSPTDDYLNLIEVCKPHTKAVTVVTINPKNTIVVTGSEDCTIFVHQIKPGNQYLRLVPIGFIPVTGEVTHCTWKPKKEATILVSCKNGTFCEVDLPQEAPEYEPVSYHLKDVAVKRNRFVSIKSEVRRNLKLAEIQAQRQAILDAKRNELKLKEEETGVSVDVEAILEALQEELDAELIDLPEIYIPKEPNPILFASYVGKTIWLSMGGYDAGYMYEYNFTIEGPVTYRMIADADDMEISSHHYYHNNKYLILGMSDGRIRVVKINPSDHSNLSNYWSLSMHDNDNGIIRQICFNYNHSFMFTCGNDGNVFSYNVSPEDYKVVNLDNVVSKGFPTTVRQDIDDAKALSLEEAKNRVEYEEKMKEANAYKRDIMEVLKELEKKFEALLRRNQALPPSQQLATRELSLDSRITEDLKKFLKEEMDAVKSRLAWQVEKAVVQHRKVNNYFIKPLQTHSLRVHGIINKEMYAETFRLKQLGPGFEELKKLVQIKLEEQEAKGRAQARIFSEEEIVETIMRRPNPVEGLLKQIVALGTDYNQNLKLRRLLRKYRERKDKLESRRIEWYEMMKKKPNPEKPDPEDVASIELAKETVGDYQLKTAPDYKMPKDARITTAHVYQQLLNTREKIYNTKLSYNEKVLNLREKKLKMIERHQYLRDMLLEISKEIPKEKIRYPPNLPTFVEDVEFPEKKFRFDDDAVFEELPKRYKAAYAPENTKKKELRPLDREYELLILEKRGQKVGKVPSRLSLMKYSGLTGSGDIGNLEAAGQDDNLHTPWEKECKKLRVVTRLYEQDGIIEEMDVDIRTFDEEIVRLNEQKYKVEVDVKFLELYLLTLYQEVLILKKFEAAEEEKENKLFEKLREKHEIQKKMNEINNKVEGRGREIRRCEEEIKNLITVFHAATAENKFYDFLKRIFKKKYRPPKIKTDDSDSESESESSSSSEDEDAKSFDSKDIGPIRLDETVCPSGCDPQLYEWTFAQRSARHALELNILEERKQIDLNKKEYEVLMKKIKHVETQYVACKEDLEEYIREKQRNLNEVETVVVLHLSQIQNFKSESEIEKISDSVVFSSSNLTSLYKRVGELEKETSIEKQKHEKNRQHLTRMKVDINHMKQLIVQLTEDINEAMIKKFGMKVDIDDIEESLLKRMVAEMRAAVMELDKSFEKRLEAVREELTRKENEYARKMQDNTERYNLLTVLQDEKNKIQETIKRQTKTMCSEKEVEEEKEEKDCERLQKMIEMQQEKIRDLRNEIAMLKLKVKPKPPAVNEQQLPEVFQRVLIKTCDGEVEEINARVRDEIRDICEEAEEIAHDAREGCVSKEEEQRMRKLTLDMMKKLPEKCRSGVMSRFSTAAAQDFPFEGGEGLGDILSSLKPGSFLELIQAVKELIDSMMPVLEGAEE